MSEERPCLVAPAATLDVWLMRAGLTLREREVVALVMEGRTFAEAAQRLGVAQSTAKTYFQRALPKLGVSSREELAALWDLCPDGEASDVPGGRSVAQMLPVAARRACVPALLLCSLMLPLRIVHDGCVGWPVALGCGLAQLAVGCLGERVRSALGGAGRMVRYLSLFFGVVCVVLRAIFPVDAWLGGIFSLVTAAGTAGLALVAPRRAEERDTIVELLSRALLCAVCVICVMLPVVAGVASVLSALVVAADEWKGLVSGVRVGEEPDKIDVGPAMVINGRQTPAWSVAAVATLVSLGWAMAASLGRPFSLGLPVLAGLLLCDAALVLETLTSDGGSLPCLACDVAVSLAVGVAMRVPVAALVAFPLVKISFALPLPWAHARGRSASGGSPSSALIGPVRVAVIAAGVAAMTAPALAALYHTLAASALTRMAVPCLFVALAAIGGCMALAPIGQELVRECRMAESGDDGTGYVGAYLSSHGLSETQVTVLRAIYEGKTSREIEGSYVLSRGTVNSARREGYRALGVHSAEELRRCIDDRT